MHWHHEIRQEALDPSAVGKPSSIALPYDFLCSDTGVVVKVIYTHHWIAEYRDRDIRIPFALSPDYRKNGLDPNSADPRIIGNACIVASLRYSRNLSDEERSAVVENMKSALLNFWRVPMVPPPRIELIYFRLY